MVCIAPSLSKALFLVWEWERLSAFLYPILFSLHRPHIENTVCLGFRKDLNAVHTLRMSFFHFCCRLEFCCKEDIPCYPRTTAVFTERAIQLVHVLPFNLKNISFSKLVLLQTQLLKRNYQTQLSTRKWEKTHFESPCC